MLPTKWAFGLILAVISFNLSAQGLDTERAVEEWFSDGSADEAVCRRVSSISKGAIPNDTCIGRLAEKNAECLELIRRYFGEQIETPEEGRAFAQALGFCPAALLLGHEAYLTEAGIRYRQK